MASAYGPTEPLSSSAEPHRDARGEPVHRDAVGLDDNDYFRRASQTSQPNRFLSWKRIAALSLVGASVFFGTAYLNGYHNPVDAVTGDAG